MHVTRLFCPPLKTPRARGGSGGSSGRAPLRAASARARMRLLQAADELHAPSNERLPFGGTLPAAFAPARLPTAPGARPATNKRRRGEALDDEPVARGDAPPTFAGIQTIPSAC